jgi:hypothetical protein
MSNILNCLITEKLINYLNFINSYIELKSGIYKLCIKKISNENILWDDVLLLLSTIYFNNINSLNDYNELLHSYVSNFDIIGLNITVYIDLLLFDKINENFHKIKSYEDIHLITPKIIKYDKYDFIKTNILLDDLKLQKCTTEMCKNCLSMLFSNEEYLNTLKTNSLYLNDNSIIIDENNIILDGNYKLMMLKFLFNKDEKISCIKLKNVFTNKIKTEVSDLSDFLNIKYEELLKFLSSKYKTDIYIIDGIMSNEYIDIFSSHIENWIKSL